MRSNPQRTVPEADMQQKCQLCEWWDAFTLVKLKPSQQSWSERGWAERDFAVLLCLYPGAASTDDPQFVSWFSPWCCHCERVLLSLWLVEPWIKWTEQSVALERSQPLVQLSTCSFALRFYGMDMPSCSMLWLCQLRVHTARSADKTCMWKTTYVEFEKS